MKIETVIRFRHDILLPPVAEFDQVREINKYFRALCRYSGCSTMGVPVITVSTRLSGNIDGHKFESDAKPGLRFFVSETCDATPGGLRVTNARTGKVEHLSADYIVVNSRARQIYPPLSGKQKSAFDKFIKTALCTRYEISKVK